VGARSGVTRAAANSATCCAVEQRLTRATSLGPVRLGGTRGRRGQSPRYGDQWIEWCETGSAPL